MNFIARLFWLPLNNRIVDRCILPDLAKSLEDLLIARGFKSSALSSELLVELLNLAYERARAQEPDRCARYGTMWRNIEQIAEGAARIHKGTGDVDERIENILRLHGRRI